MGKKFGNWYQYSGATHIHTTESDGTKPIQDVIAIGNRSGLDFMMFADHMNLNNRNAGHEGIYKNMLVVIGYEHNDLKDCHHYLMFDSPKTYPKDLTPYEYVEAGAKDNVIGIMAHPDEIRNRMVKFPPYPWTDYTVKGFTGIEIWNQMSEWMEKLTPYNKLIMAFSPRKSMEGPTDRILKQWDDWNKERRVVGIASVDAHAFPIKLGPLKVEIFPYKVHFKCLRTHIILDKPMSSDFEKAKSQLYNAIRNCRIFNSNMRWGDAEGFEFYAENENNKATCGDVIPLIENTKITVSLPSQANLKLIHNGDIILQSETDLLEYKISEKGLYRVEAWKKNRGWIYSNHIRVGI